MLCGVQPMSGGRDAMNVFTTGVRALKTKRWNNMKEPLYGLNNTRQTAFCS